LPTSCTLSRALAAVILVCWALQAAAASNAADQVTAYLRDLKSWSADFTQVETSAGGQVTRRTSGHFDLQKPGKFRWSYGAPTSQLLLSDGRNLWFYDEDLGQVTVRSVEGNLGNTPAMLLSGTASVGDAFQVAELPRIEGLNWYLLKPKSAGDFRELRIAFRYGEPVRMQLDDKLGASTRLEFAAPRRNPKLAPTLFAFVPPPGVDVIGRPIAVP
jgi:outer membrane lipoprotein carrier protein